MGGTPRILLYEANEITDSGKRRASLLSLCGEEVYDTLRSLLVPRRPSEVSYADIVKVITEHYNPRPSELLARCIFYKRDQWPTESIADYVAALRALAKDCNFGTSSAPTPESAALEAGEQTHTTAATSTSGTTTSTALPLDIMLRDRFVCGVADSHLQQRLLAERGGITFQRALQIALTAESALREQTQLRRECLDTKVHKTSATTSSKTKKANNKKIACYRCGGEHRMPDCTFPDSIVCNFCHKKGHMERVCFSKKKRTKKGGQAKQVALQDTHDLSEDDNSEALYTLYNMRGKSSTPTFAVTVHLNDQPLRMEVDSGATFSIISEKTFNKLWPAGQSQPMLVQDDLHLELGQVTN
ncbi:uncharacterized protein LOC135378825 [Ornithodoros turicata]|uniref:uncharacterized protein LOC135378825 n=1 Tax=Ornithodoros turicata TaxID=34597 RepID=UPI003138883F